MTTRDNLIHHLQELYSFQRDVIPVLAEMQYQSDVEELMRILHDEEDTLRGGLETLERALNLLSAQFRQERSALVPGFKEASYRFRHRYNPSLEQMDIYAALDAISVGHFCLGAYLGNIELARGIGEQDIAKLLDEDRQRLQDSVAAIERFLPTLIAGIGRGEIRKAA